MGDRCLPHIIPRERAFNIDDEVDFVIVESLKGKFTWIGRGDQI